MDAQEYANLERVEQDHWYYAGKRELVRRWLARLGRPQAGDVLLDCGAGTGRFAAEMAKSCRVLALDDHEESLALLRRRLPAESVLALGPTGIPLPDGGVTIITALDVLEHIQDDVSALAEMRRVLKPGGVLVATVPAGMELWSDWDVGLHHHRRYSRATLGALFDPQAWDVVTLHYTNTLVYPAVWLVRKVARRKQPGGARAEDSVPWGPVNRVLRWLFVATGLRPPPLLRGVSLLVVAVRR